MEKERKGFITDGDLLVEPIPFLEINALKLEEQVNEHASLQICGKIREEDEGQLNVLTASRTEIVLKTKKGMILFRGILSRMGVEHSGRQIIVEVLALSYSCLLDRKKKKRPFHNPERTIEDIMRIVCDDTEHTNVIFGSQCERQAGVFLMQYEETDWEFLKRTASLGGQTLIPDITAAYPAFYAGRPMEIIRREVVNPDSYSVIHDGENLYRISSRQDWLKLGDQIRFQGLELYVRKVSVTLLQAVLCGTYELCFREGMDTDKKENEILAGKSVEGVVQNIDRDRVRVNVRGADGNDNGESCWFPYSTVYASADGSGWYCMPEPGAHVRIRFADSDEGNAYAVSSISRYKADGGQKDRMKDYTRRYIRNVQGMEIVWTPECVRISANGAGVAEINKNGVISFMAGSRIVMRAEQDVSIRAGRDIQISGGRSVAISCGAKAELNMDDGGIIELKGTEIYTN